MIDGWGEGRSGFAREGRRIGCIEAEVQWRNRYANIRDRRWKMGDGRWEIGSSQSHLRRSE
jgi:hypothetical protein